MKTRYLQSHCIIQSQTKLWILLPQATKNRDPSSYENSASVVVSASHRQCNGNAPRNVNKNPQFQQRKPDTSANKSNDAHNNSHYGHTGRRQGGRRDDHRHHHNRRRHEFHHQNGTDQANTTSASQQPCGSNQRWQWLQMTMDSNGIWILWFFIENILWHTPPLTYSTVIICLFSVYYKFIVIQFCQIVQPWQINSVFFHYHISSEFKLISWMNIQLSIGFNLFYLLKVIMSHTQENYIPFLASQ